MKKSTIFIFISLLFSSICFAEGQLNLKGNVGGYDIEMIIDSSDYNTGDFTGKYRYLSQKNYLNIEGTNYGNVLYIVEFYNEKQTGTFILDVSSEGIAGWWTNDEKAFKVELFVGEGDESLLDRKSDEDFSEECNGDISGTYEVNYYYINDYFATEDSPYYELGYNGGTSSFELLDDDTLKFSIDLVCGPTFHLASAEGVAVKDGDVYKYSEVLWDEEGDACEITFKFSEKGVYATSNGNFACGFGARAYMDHNLIKVKEFESDE